MNIKEFAEKYDFKILNSGKIQDKEITGAYICDMLSWVMSHAKKGDVWITVLNSMNVIAVALLCEVACVIIPEDIDVEEKIIAKAENEGVVILSTDKTSFEIACLLATFLRS